MRLVVANELLLGRVPFQLGFQLQRDVGEMANGYRAMADLDIVMTAAAPSEAPLIEEVGKFSMMERPSLTMPFNVTGTPAMSVCCGYSPAGLPLSFQIVGRRFEDATVLRLAHAYEQATEWRDRRPQL